MENLLATPLRPIEVMVGKIVPYFGIGMVQVLVILAAAALIFEVPFVGSLTLLLAVTLLFTLVCLALGSIYAIGLSLVGLQFGLVIGLIAGAISFIPFVGTFVGAVMALGMALAQFPPEWIGVVKVAAVFVVGQMLEGNFLSPKLVGDRVGLHPVWIMFALLAGGSLFGFTGVLIAVPVAAVLGVVVRHFIARYRESALYRGGAHS